MLELNKIKNQSKSIVNNLKKRGIDVSKQIQLILDLDKKRIANQQSLDEILERYYRLVEWMNGLNHWKKYVIDSIRS